MPVKMQCPSCRARFSAMDELVGEVVECPQCRTMLEVPHPELSVGGGKPTAATDPDADDEFRLAPAEGRAPLPQISLEDLVAASQADTDRSPPAGPQTPAALPTGARRPTPRECPECGEALGADGMLCTACGYHTVLKRKITSDLSDLEENDKAGFDRWLSDQLEVGESAESVLLWADMLLAVVFLIVGVVWRPWSLGVVVPAAFLYVYWRIRNRLRRQHEGQIIGLRGPLWRLILQVMRLVSWRSLSDFKRVPPSLDLRLRTDADTAVAGADLSTVEVVDCAASELSDAGLLCLDNALALRYLVLTKCRVSREAVARLQSRRRDCWIWL